MPGSRFGYYEEFTRAERTEGSSDRTFGLVIAAALTLVGLAPYLHGHRPRLWALAGAAVMLLLALARPSTLHLLNRGWTLLGVALHHIVSPIVLTLMFALAIVPTGLVMRLFGRDPLTRRFDKGQRSYWIERPEQLNSGEMYRQF